MDIEKLAKEAQEDVDKEFMEEAKEKLTEKYKDLKTAKKVIANIEREITDLKDELSQDLKD